MLKNIIVIAVVGALVASLVLLSGYLVLEGSPGLALIPVAIILGAASSFAYHLANKEK